MAEGMNKLDAIIRDLRELEHYAVNIGVPGGPDGTLVTIAVANEYGAHISPKRGKYLTIPSPLTKKADGRTLRPRDIPGLFKPKGKRILATSNGGSLDVYFYLVESVTIPERSFFRSTQAEKSKSWASFMGRQVAQIYSGQLSGSLGEPAAKVVYRRLGERIVADVRAKMRATRSPGNAPATIANKRGTDNPLVDSGRLESAINYEVVRV